MARRKKKKQPSNRWVLLPIIAAVVVVGLVILLEKSLTSEDRLALSQLRTEHLADLDKIKADYEERIGELELQIELLQQENSSN